MERGFCRVNVDSYTGCGLERPGGQTSINKIAIEAYCSEAQSKSALLADGSVSYKRVADLASERALVEHPNVYRDSSAWKVKIVALLD